MRMTLIENGMGRYHTKPVVPARHCAARRIGCRGDEWQLLWLFPQTHKSSSPVSSQSMMSTISKEINDAHFVENEISVYKTLNYCVHNTQQLSSKTTPSVRVGWLNCIFIITFIMNILTIYMLPCLGFIIMWEAKIERWLSFTHSSYQ